MRVDKEAIFKEGIERYKEHREVTNDDLVSKVRELMVVSGLTKRLGCFDNSQIIMESRTKTDSIQRYSLNMYWTIQLLKHSAKTMEARNCLVMDGPLDKWLLLFKEKVLPVIIENNLPQ